MCSSTLWGWIFCSSSALRNVWSAKTCHWISVNVKLHIKEKPSKQNSVGENSLQTLLSTKPSMHHSYIISRHLKIFFWSQPHCARLCGYGWTACFDASGLSRHLSCGGWLPHSPCSVEKMRLRWATRASLRHRAITVEVESWPPSRFLMDFRRHRQTHSWIPNKLIRGPQICGSTISPPTQLCLLHFFFLSLRQAVTIWETDPAGILSSWDKCMKYYLLLY